MVSAMGFFTQVLPQVRFRCRCPVSCEPRSYPQCHVIASLNMPCNHNLHDLSLQIHLCCRVPSQPSSTIPTASTSSSTPPPTLCQRCHTSADHVFQKCRWQACIVSDGCYRHQRKQWQRCGRGITTDGWHAAVHACQLSAIACGFWAVDCFLELSTSLHVIGCTVLRYLPIKSCGWRS